MHAPDNAQAAHRQHTADQAALDRWATAQHYAPINLPAAQAAADTGDDSPAARAATTLINTTIAMLRAPWSGTPWASTRHTYHPEVLNHLDQFAVDAATAAHTRPLAVARHHRTTTSVTAGTLIRHRLTVAAFADHTRDTVAHYKDIAAEPITISNNTGPDGPAVHVAHPATGLHAHFTLDADGTFGAVNSDSDPSAVTYTGLGIGTRLYLAAAAQLPDVRWRDCTVSSEYGHGIRRALHAADPWRWQDKTCPACRDPRPGDAPTNMWAALTPDTAAARHHPALPRTPQA